MLFNQVTRMMERPNSPLSTVVSRWHAYRGETRSRPGSMEAWTSGKAEYEKVRAW